jgi:hypothetical protein
LLIFAVELAIYPIVLVTFKRIRHIVTMQCVHIVLSKKIIVRSILFFQVAVRLELILKQKYTRKTKMRTVCNMTQNGPQFVSEHSNRVFMFLFLKISLF